MKSPIYHINKIKSLLPANYKTWQYNLAWAVYCLHEDNIYPSAYQICKKLCRHVYNFTGSLNGRECKFRTKIFDKLIIKKKMNQYKNL